MPLVWLLTGGVLCWLLDEPMPLWEESLDPLCPAGLIIPAEPPVPLQEEETSLTLCRISVSLPVPELISVELLIALALELCDRAGVPVIETVWPTLLASCDTSEPITLYCFGVDPPVEIK